jgi:hypothetical protein
VPLAIKWNGLNILEGDYKGLSGFRLDGNGLAAKKAEIKKMTQLAALSPSAGSSRGARRQRTNEKFFDHRQRPLRLNGEGDTGSAATGSCTIRYQGEYLKGTPDTYGQTRSL